MDKQRQAELDDLRLVMETPFGMSVLSKILEYTGYLENTFHPDASVHSYASGKRDVGLWLMQELAEVDPETPINLLRKMSHDHRDRDNRNRNRED